jgi:hypothetical protein
MSLVEYARAELERANVEEDVRPSLLAAVEAFAEYGHSGGSAAVCIQILHDLLQFKPLTPLTGEDDEWMDVAEYGAKGGVLWQNKRRSTVFKDAEGAYDIDVIKHYPNGETTSGCPDEGWPRITFPYTPQTAHVYLEHDPE